MRKTFKLTVLAVIGIVLTACSGRVPYNLGVQNSTLAKCLSRANCVSSVATNPSHQVAALELALSADQAWPLINKAVTGNAAAQIVTSDGRYLHAEYTGCTMRFIDDLEILLSSDMKHIDARSTSRIGYSDGGVNRKRVDALRDELTKLGVVRN